jgi:thiol-disulfide isomerase/thioredoxin
MCGPGCSNASNTGGASGGAGAANAKNNSEALTVTFAQDFDELARALTPRGKPLVVNHWSTDCIPCIAELPYLASVADRFAGKVDFVGVAWDNLAGKATKPGPHQDSVRDAVNGIRNKKGAKFETIVAPPDLDELARRFKLLNQAVPQTFVFDAKGARVFEISGEILDDEDKAAFEKAIQSALR